MSFNNDCASCDNKPQDGKEYCLTCLRLQDLEKDVYRLNKQVAKLTTIINLVSDASRLATMNLFPFDPTED